MSEPQGRGTAWTEERGSLRPSDEARPSQRGAPPSGLTSEDARNERPSEKGRRRVKAPPRRAESTVLEAALADLGLRYESPQAGAYLVRLEGEHKLATMTWLIVGAHSLHVEAFFCRQPDENHAAFYRFLLERNGRMYGVHFALDPVGDVYLVGRLPLASVSADEIDRLCGCVLTYSDENFDQALMLGFASSIRREWAWRTKRGESLANLTAFARLADPEDG
jgi:Putative bacterial sensory transduction regulator